MVLVNYQTKVIAHSRKKGVRISLIFKRGYLMSTDFNTLADLWVESRCFASPSALHGWLTGFLASGARMPQERWLTEAEQYLELEDPVNAGLAAVLQQLYEKTLNDLSADSMAYQLLLPADEDADIDEQVDCLAQWSKGFLDGFGASGNVQGELPEDVFEVLQDLDAFSQASLEDHDPSNELLYLEIIEHARVAALTVFYALNQSSPNHEVLH